MHFLKLFLLESHSGTVPYSLLRFVTSLNKVMVSYKHLI